MRQTKAKLLESFPDDACVRGISRDDALDWRKSLKDVGLSEAAIRTHCGNVKTMLAEAKRRKVIEDNPFEMLKSGPTPSKYTRYITPDEIQRVIDACPNAEWRLLFGLARYAGLRIPSETHRLTWADVDFERARLTVHSPKTERWEGHDQRVIPITPKLMALLHYRFETMPEGEAPLVGITGKGAVIRRVRGIWAAAGVEPWARLWQTLRASCEKEWAIMFPQFAVIAARSVGGNVGMVPSRRARRRDARGNSRGYRLTLFRMSGRGMAWNGRDSGATRCRLPQLVLPPLPALQSRRLRPQWRFSPRIRSHADRSMLETPGPRSGGASRSPASSPRR